MSYLFYFALGVKIHQIALKRSMVILADIFAVLLRYFQSSVGNLIIKFFIWLLDSRFLTVNAILLFVVPGESKKVYTFNEP